MKDGMTMEGPTLWLIAGPDGVGKTTYARPYLRTVAGTVAFVKVDGIAQGLSPFDVDARHRAVSRVALETVRRPLAVTSGERQSFAIETTLAGRTWLQVAGMAKAAGWRVGLLYFVVRDVETTHARIARRVAEGCHQVPESDAQRRFTRSLSHVGDYVALADVWRIFDANGLRPFVAAEGRTGCAGFPGDLAGLPGNLSVTLRSLPPCQEGDGA
jgi:predicted ABC-type ATPase